MTALPVPRPEDVYDAETLAGFRAAGYWRDETLSTSVENHLLAHPGVAAAVVVAALPTTMTGKVQKFLLRDQARALAAQPPKRRRYGSTMKDCIMSLSSCSTMWQWYT